MGGSACLPERGNEHRDGRHAHPAQQGRFPRVDRRHEHRFQLPLPASAASAMTPFCLSLS